MCGIVGYIGSQNPISLILRGLEKLEYRGYDSSGISTVQNQQFEVFRSVGKLHNLRKLLNEHHKIDNAPMGANAINVGIGHTRWATHGRPSEENAHPHTAGKICLVHNGIIENYATLKEELLAKKCKFLSETDTEIAAHLINLELSKSGDLLLAVKAAISRIVGSYALVVISSDDPSRIIVAKNASPVILGKGDGENFVASDIPAILEHTRHIVILEDNEVAEITASGIKIEKDNTPVTRDPIVISWDPITAEKGGFRHFMLKEIYEQPQVITDTFRSRIDLQTASVNLDELTISKADLQKIKRISIAACGTAWHAALVIKFYIEKFARIPVEVDYASEFRYRNPVIDDSVLFLTISQSGETADTLGSLNLAAGLTPHTLAICNVVGSSIARKSSHTLYTHAGPEISVASTKAFVTQVTLGYLFGLHLATVRGAISHDQEKLLIEDLLKVPLLVNNALATDNQMSKVARKYGKSNDILYLGRGILYPIALEGALKLKELSYLHAEGYPAGEMKHGPIALINEETPVIVVLGHDGLNYEKAMSNLIEVESRGGRVIAITDVATQELRNIAWETIEIGQVPESVMPLAMIVPLQLLAYHVAVYRGTDVDQPRNLAKSVTVE